MRAYLRGHGLDVGREVGLMAELESVARFTFSGVSTWDIVRAPISGLWHVVPFGRGIEEAGDAVGRSEAIAQAKERSTRHWTG